LIRPAVRLARDGFPVGWHTSLTIAQDLALLSRFPATRAIFTDDGRPWTMLTGLTPTRLVQADLARTLDALADDGWETFYRGDLARAIVDGVRGMGGLLADEDLRDYAVRVGPALMADYRGHAVATAQAPSGGTTLLESLRLMEQANLAALGHNTADALHHLIESFRQAFVDRFAYLADPRFVQIPEAALLTEGYARSRAAAFGPSARPIVSPGGRDELGVRHALARSVPAYGAGEHTTHVSVVDARGNAVALTQTLLSSWGSRVVAPGTGVLLNNGMMWFDPEPGRPNSVAGGKRPLANMTPALVLENDAVRLAVGAMGGRKIINAVTQVIANVVDYGMGVQAAITAPRVDCSTAVTLVSSRIDPTVVAALERRGHALQAIREDIGSVPFASPVGILRATDGTLHGGANPYYPAMAIGL
ncbi:MAG TPA: gamma-glutamyltransferase, partial [Thermomicrobiales bacterium]|nr:gamma-glutamyltransferase [Thermomicrobiales bacterium]